VAKVLESLDREIYALGDWVSGHTLKHLAAAAGVWLLLAALQRRRLRG
jgi:pyruvate/2-oxoglutarate dehydrogenase complex dihydrolipoamide dehydrogenase (E3) component